MLISVYWEPAGGASVSEEVCIKLSPGGYSVRGPDRTSRPTDPRAPPIYYDTTTERVLNVTSGYYEDQQIRALQ
jgi:hypothetical protein